MTPVHIRWMIRRDMREVLYIEDACRGWGEEEILQALRKKNCIGMVAEKGDVVVGLTIYTLREHHIELDRLAVHPDWLYQGIGTQMLNKIKSKISQHRRNKLVAVVPERETGGQLFLKACGLKADRVLRSHFDGQDGYRFLWKAEQHEPGLEPIFDEKA